MSVETQDDDLARGADGGRFAGTRHNKAAGRALRATRQQVKQSAFASMLSTELGVPISPTTLSGWETGRRTVPAPVLMAAAMAAKQSLDAVLAESGDAEVVHWVQGLGLPQQLASLATLIESLQSELADLGQQYAGFQTQVIEILTHAGLPYPRSGTPATERRPSRRPAAGGGEG